ncbi:DNA alkylation repair protein [Burkholderia cepacia]|uniref:DNA alkylation repair protein n=1 Tax=Burkholderia cepacia TaxID=292 RepID=UPI000F55CF64|nr:DNA alkylation repair protein [Burkholderia cepacia]MCA8325073.1 DNA alkylation repair protein [Burkholderia cepacia]RQT71201.1 DNA alkylation repair protein [Burkholderia cepacia]
MTTTQVPVPLKESLGKRQFHALSDALHSIEPAFDRPAFLATALEGLDGLTLMERVRRASLAIDTGARPLPGGYDAVLALLQEAAPRLGRGFVSLIAPDYVGQYGRHAFDRSMDALKYFTPFGTSEFAVREFLRIDPARALATMEAWSHDTDDAVRRLASEGSRPRLPWSFRLRDIEADPSLAARILDNLRSDPSAYVRRSVANHLNDVAKTHPAWVLDRAERWGGDHPHTRWIVRHALRTLVKQGNARALAILGADSAPRLEIGPFGVTPAQVVLGESITLACELQSTAETAQRLVVDYRIAYVKQNGDASPKVFKLKGLTLEPGQRVTLQHSRPMRDFTTRRHYAGRHEVELIVNGQVVARSFFELAV